MLTWDAAKCTFKLFDKKHNAHMPYGIYAYFIITFYVMVVKKAIMQYGFYVSHIYDFFFQALFFALFYIP